MKIGLEELGIKIAANCVKNSSTIRDLSWPMDFAPH